MYESENAIMPPPVRTARLLMWVQVALGALGFMLLLVIAGSLRGGNLIPPWVFLIGSVQVGVMGLLAANLKSQRAWVRWTILVLEGGMTLFRVQSLFDGGVLSALLALALSIGVIVQLAGREARDWFSR